MKAVFLLVLCYLAGTHAFRCRQAKQLNRIRQIDCGNGKVVATNSYYQPFYLTQYGWYSLSSQRLKHVTVGNAGTFGVDRSNYVYKLVAGSFVRDSRGLRLSQVDAGGDNHAVGATTRGYCLRRSSAMTWSGSGALSWTYLSITFRYISCGLNNICCGVSTTSRLYCTRKIDPNSCRHWGWFENRGVTGIKMVEVSSEGRVFVVTTSGLVYERIGVSYGRPQGLRWSRISMCLPITHLCFDLRTLWVVTNAGFAMRCLH